MVLKYLQFWDHWQLLVSFLGDFLQTWGCCLLVSKQQFLSQEEVSPDEWIHAEDTSLLEPLLLQEEEPENPALAGTALSVSGWNNLFCIGFIMQTYKNIVMCTWIFDDDLSLVDTFNNGGFRRN